MSFRVHRVSDAREERPARRWAPWLLLVLNVARGVASWARAVRERRQEEDQRTRRISILKNILIVLVALFCAFLLFASIAHALLGIRILSLETFFTVAGGDIAMDENGATNILLLGSGDASHDGKDLTDTIMVASLHPTSRSAMLLSLPRDLYMLKTEKMGAGRINSLYRDYKGYLKYKENLSEAEASKQALRELGHEVGRRLGMEIAYVAKIDFVGFVLAVDELGGVDVVVPYDINDVEYPGPNYTFETFTLPEGRQLLDGETALRYVRSRHTTSDFDRSARQQQLLTALMERVRQGGVLRSASRISSLLGIIGDHTETTMSTREIIGLAGLAKDLDHSRIISMQLNDRNGLYDGLAEAGGLLYNPPRDSFEGASVLLPVSLPENPVTWRQIQLLVDLLQEHLDVYIQNATVNIFNAGARPGLARKLANELTLFGLTVDKVENAEQRDREKSSIAVGEEHQHLGTFFSTLLDMPWGITETLPPGTVEISVAKDYVYKPLQETYPSKP